MFQRFLTYLYSWLNFYFCLENVNEKELENLFKEDDFIHNDKVLIVDLKKGV